MISQKAQRLAQVTNQLTEILMTAAICAQEIRAEVHAELDAETVVSSSRHSRNNSANCALRPLVDQSTLSVTWKGKSLHLGHTRLFLMLDCLSRQPNQYVTHVDLLKDVWDDKEIATSTIRSAARDLRRKLKDGGMKDLAAAIKGHMERYVLKL